MRQNNENPAVVYSPPVSEDDIVRGGADDPERDRVEALLQRKLRGDATEAETEELAMYAADRPDLRAHIEAEAGRGPLGKDWLARVHQDNAIARVEGSKRAKIERGVGLALALGGWAATLVLPSAGLVAGLGLAIVLYSLVRVRLANHANDPYKDIVQ